MLQGMKGEQFPMYLQEAQAEMNVSMQKVLIAIVNLKCSRGYARGATQATPVNAKYGGPIAREAELLMMRATEVSISQEKCTSIEFLRKSNLDVFTTMLAA
jgi:hypothetical protein